MRLKSIKEKQYIIIVLIIMLLCMAVLNYYLDRIVDSSEDKLHQIIVLEKTFSDILLQEIPLAHNPSQHEVLTNKYAKLRKNFADILSDSEDDLLADRRYYFDKKFFVDREVSWLDIVVHESFNNLLESVRYIHEHHIGYLKNLLRRGETKQDYDIGESFQRSPFKSAPEIEIIKIAVYIQTSLVGINSVFNEIEKDPSIANIREEFSKRMKRFYSLINTFESYSLDAQDGILAEELLINGRNFEKLFSNWVTIEKNRRELISKIGEKRDRLFKLLKIKSENINKSNKRTKRINVILQFIFLILTIFLVLLIIFFGRQVTNEITKTATETKRIQHDISYQIRIDDSTSDEFQIVFNALNSMAYNLNYQTQQLKESEEKYRTVLEANPNPVIVYDMKGKVVYFNPAFTSIFGWALEERLGKKMDVFIPDENLLETVKMIDKVKAGENFSGVETHRYTKKGNIVHVNVSAGIYRDRKGKPIGSVINLRDISNEKRLETQLHQAQKMEVLGTLAGGVAHDLNNVLSGIVSYPDLLLMQLPKDSPLLDPLLTIQESGKKAAAIVQDLLTLARRGVATEEVVNLNSLIDDYLKTPEYRKLKSYHPTTFVETNLESKLFNIIGSRVHLAKTIMNLVSNAAEAITDGGKICISTENRFVNNPLSGHDSIEEGDYATMIVSDTGVGIRPGDIDRIFEPFFTKKVMGRSGTGLGMAVVRGTVEDHKGYIDVQSTEGTGSTFTLYFPVTIQKRLTKQASLSIEDYIGNGESILVIDDSKKQREIACNLLEALGYEVNSVSSGEKAVSYLRTNKVDLIILDMIMDPGIDGLATYRKIIEISPKQKAIIASGFSETDRVREAQKIGVGQYIKKPYTLEQIGIAVFKELY